MTKFSREKNVSRYCFCLVCLLLLDLFEKENTSIGFYWKFLIEHVVLFISDVRGVG